MKLYFLKPLLFHASIYIFCMNAVFVSAQSWQDVGQTNEYSIYPNSNIATDGQELFISINNDEIDGKVSVMHYDGMDTWNMVGDSNVASGTPYNSQILSVMNGAPYVVTTDSLERVIVMTYDGTNWVLVGQPLSIGAGNHPSLTTDNNALYVGYYDVANDGVTVKQFDDTNWTTLGTTGFTLGETDYVSLSVENGVPYIATQESETLSILSFDGVNWNYLGQGLSNQLASNIHIATDNGMIYVSFEDQDNQCRLTVITYENGIWSTLDMNSFPFVPGVYSSLTVYDGIPYVSFRELNGALSVVGYIDNTWNYIGQSEFSLGVVTHSDITFFGNAPHVVYRDVDNSNAIQVKKIDAELSILETENASVSIYPNPSSSLIILESKEPMIRIQISDSRGRVMITTTESSIDISQWETGIYLAEILTERGKHTKRIIKQ